MSSGKSIIKKISIYFIGTFATKMLSVLLVPIYAYFVSATELGEYDYIVAISSTLFPIIYVVIWEAVLRYCIKKEGGFPENKVFSTVLVFTTGMTVLSIIVFTVIFLFGNKSVSTLFVLMFIISQGLSTIWQFATRALGETRRYVISSIIGAASVVFFEALFIFFYKLDYIGLCISNLVSQFLVIIVIESKIHLLRRFDKKKIDLKILKTMLLFTIPLVINNVSLYLYNSGSKIIIKNHIGAYENGLYSFASKFSLLIGLFSTVISMAVIEEAYSFKSIDEYKNRMSVLISKISKGYFSLILLALPTIYILYSIAFEKTEYYDSVDYVFLLLVGALFTALSNNFGSAFQVTDNTKYISITTVFGAVIAIGVSIATVKPFGIVGVLLGGVLGPLSMMLARAFYAKRATNLHVDWLKMFLLFVICLGEYIILVLFKGIWINVAMFLIASVFTVIINRKELIPILKAIKKKG